MKTSITKKDIEAIFNKRIITSIIVNLINNYSKNSDKWFNKFTPPFSKETRIKGFLSQSSNIKFGDAWEEAVRLLLERKGYKHMSYTIDSSKFIPDVKKKSLQYDIHVEKDGIIYVGELKMRDNHDSTKKTGQLQDLHNKIIVSYKKYSPQKIIGFELFLDPSLKANGKSILKELNQLDENIIPKNNRALHVFYGAEFFNSLHFKHEWEELTSLIQEWRKKNEGFISKLQIKKEDMVKTKKLLDKCEKRIMKKTQNASLTQEYMDALKKVLDYKERN